MRTIHRVLSKGEGFRAYAHVETNWHLTLLRHCALHGVRLAAVSEHLFENQAIAEWPKRIRMFLESNESGGSYKNLIVKTLNALERQGDRFYGDYTLRGLHYTIMGSARKADTSVAEVCAFVFDRDRTAAYPMPIGGIDQSELLRDLKTWAEQYAPDALGTVERFQKAVIAGEIANDDVIALRTISRKIRRGVYVPTKDGDRQLSVGGIHALLDSIQLLERTDYPTLI
jgi:hypothetical protein